MSELTAKEAGEKLGILPDSVGYLIRSGKIKARKNFLNHYRISESALKNYQDKIGEHKNSKIFTAADIEDLGYSSKILYNGILPTIKMNGITVSELKDVIRYIKSKINRNEGEEDIICIREVQVGLRYGIDMESALFLCKIFGNYLRKSKTKATLIYKGKRWEHRGPAGNTVDQLLKKEIRQNEMVTIEIEGIPSQAHELLDFIVRVIKKIRV